VGRGVYGFFFERGPTLATVWKMLGLVARQVIQVVGA
jgi:hypothetical protein